MKVVGTTPPSPKQRSDARSDRWYPYYAGYSSAFVECVLAALTDDRGHVLDPWNGAGTTTLVAAKLGRLATGYDINPAMATIARARLVPRTVESSLIPIGMDIAKAAAETQEASQVATEPLEIWFRKPAAAALRNIERRIVQLLEGENQAADLGMPSTVLSAFFMTALFSTTRELLAKFRSSNPTWLKHPPSPRHRLNPTHRRIAESFVQEVRNFASRLPAMPNSHAALADVLTQNALDLDHDRSFDACLTSPPYFTRVDYVRATLAELAVLGLKEHSVASLRRATTGTPVTSGGREDPGDLDTPSPLANALHSAIRAHPSKGSSNYYAPWAARYFESLGTSVANISRAVVSGGPIGIVVQDSYYKEIHVDLQQVVTELFETRSRTLVERIDFTPTHVRAWMHPSSATHRPASWETTESLLVFN